MSLILYLVIVLAGVVPPSVVAYLGHRASKKLSKDTLKEAHKIRKKAEQSASVAVENAKLDLEKSIKNFKLTDENLNDMVEKIKPDLMKAIHGKLGNEVKLIQEEMRGDENIQAYLGQMDQQHNGAGGLTERLLERVVDNFM